MFILIRPGILSVNMLKGQDHFLFAKGTSIGKSKVNEKLLTGHHGPVKELEVSIKTSDV